MSKRERFLSEMTENIRSPYEAEWEGEEGGGKFRNLVEEEYFQRVIDNIQPEAVILDLACGDGRHTLRLAERVGEVVGLDFSHNSLAKAKKKFIAHEKKVKEFAKKNPHKAAAIAAGLGVVVGASLGVLLAKGKRKK